MTDYEMNKIIVDIHRNMGLNINSKCRKREVFYSRVVYFAIIKEKSPYISLNKMGKSVGLCHSSVIYSLKAYNHLKKYIDFKDIEQDIRMIVEKYSSVPDVYCKPMVYLNE